MEVNIIYTKTFLKQVQSYKNTSLLKQIEKQTEVLKCNPFHPSLHFEKLEPKHEKTFSLRVNRQYRILLKRENEYFTFLALSKHYE